MNSIGIRRVSFTTSKMSVIGYIYQIVSNNTDKVYIGRTSNSLERRFQAHASGFKQYKAGKSRYLSSFEIFEFEDARIELLEVVYDWEDINKIEQEHIKENPNAVNRVVSKHREVVYRCDVCNNNIKLSKDVFGYYDISNFRRHERTKKHQSKISVV